MIAISVTEEQLEQLRYERSHHLHPRFQKKMEAIHLRAIGLSVGEACRIIDISANTYRAYLRDFQQGGVEGLKRLDDHGKTSKLDDHFDQILDSLVKEPARTLAEAQKRIQELTGILRSKEQVRQFLKRRGLKPLKASSMPAKAYVELQAEFKDSLIPD